MTTWFIRLGRKDERENQELYQDFAEKYSLVKIGFGIERDITSIKSAEEIKKFIKVKEGKGKQALSIRAGLVNKFINEIKIGDIIICPFSDGYWRVGEVTSKCGIIESFFEGKEKELDEFIAHYPNAKEHEFIKFKPARKVKWLDKKANINEFSEELQKELNKFMPATVNKLKVEYEPTEKPSGNNNDEDNERFRKDNSNDVTWFAVMCALVIAAISSRK